MKTAVLITLTVVLLAITLPVFAQEFPDVPPDHWAYGAVGTLQNAGIVIGYPDGTYAGKRAMTRYEFAEAISRAIPFIAEKAAAEGKAGPAGKDGAAGPAGPAGAAGPQGPPGMTPEQVAALQKMVTEFKDELASLGVDVEAVKKDVAALAERVTAVENEQNRVRLTGVANLIGRGEVRNTGTVAFDRDSKALSSSVPGVNKANILRNSSWENDFEFALKGRVSENASANVLLLAGKYMVNSAGITYDENTLWHLNLDTPLSLGPLGTAQVVVGRFPFQLTPLTLQFVSPDSYANVGILDSGDYIFDGAKAAFSFGKASVTTFASKAAPTDEFTGLMRPSFGGYELQQFAGLRGTIGVLSDGTLGLTYYQAGLADPYRAQVFGADLNAKFGQLGLAAEYAKTDPNDALKAMGGNGYASDSKNNAWNAKLNYMFGKVGVGAGYTKIEPNFFAPGNWSRLGRAVNLSNVKGATANLNYALSGNLSISADGQFLQPDRDSSTVLGRTATSKSITGVAVDGAGLDKITYWKAGVKYALTAANTVDLGWEESKWEPNTGANTRERYYTFGFGHTFNPNSSLKLLYQVVDFRAGDVAANPYGDSSYRGGVATAQVQLKY